MNPLEGLNVRQKLSFLAKDSLLYGGAAALNKAFALITFPILAWNLSVEQFGTIDLFNTLITLLTIMIVMGQDSAVARYYYEHTDENSRRDLISQSLAFQILTSTGLVPIAIILFSWGGSFTELPAIGNGTLILIAAQAIPLAAINFSQNILKWTFQRTQFLTITLGSTAASTLGLIAMLLAGYTSLPAIFGVYLATRLLFAGLGLWFVRTWLILPRGWNFLRETMPFALPFFLISALSASTPIIERASIATLLDAVSLGTYAAAAKVAMLLSLPLQAFQVAWGPFSYASFADSDAKRTFSVVLNAFACFALCGVVALTVLSPAILSILAPGFYAASAGIVVWLALARAAEGLGWITELGISLAKRPHWKIAPACVGLLVVTSVTLTLTPKFGAYAVAVAALLGILAKIALETVIAEHLHPIGWNWWRPALMLACTALFGIWSSIALRTADQIHNYLQLVAFGMIVCVVLFTIAFPKEERQRLLKVVLDWWRAHRHAKTKQGTIGNSSDDFT